MNTRNSTRRMNTVRAAARRTMAASLFEAMEPRQMMSATAVKSVDTAGPDDTMISVAGTTYVVSSTRSGGGWSQIYSTKGSAKSTKHLLDLSTNTATIASIEDLSGTADGRVFFTATGGTGNGRQLFQLNTTKGGYTQITKDTQAFYTDLMVIGSKIYLYDSNAERIVTLNSKNETKLVVNTTITGLFQAKGQLFYANGDEGVFRTDGTTAGTYKISGTLNVSQRYIFVSNDWIYFVGTENNNTSLYRSDGSGATPTKIADDFSLLNNSSAELGDYVYFSGGYYNTSPQPDDGLQLFRVKSSTGEVSIAANIVGPNGAGRAEGIHAVGTNIYYTAGDGDYLNSQGTTDRELYRYDTLTGVNKKITTGEQLAPVDDNGDGGGAGVLSSYYFTASPDKDNFRFGSRNLYRTNPATDAIEKVTSLPTYQKDSDTVSTGVEGFCVGAGGLFVNVKTTDVAGDSDTFFVPTPFSYIDPSTHVLTVEATDAADTLTAKIVGSEIVLNLNGIEERQTVANFSSIAIFLKGGDDKLTTDKNVTTPMSVVGDAGNDTLTAGSGNDSILGGAGKNAMYGGAGNDRLRGSSGYDYCEGGDGVDRIYGRGGADNLHGNNGVDVIYGDDAAGSFGNDTIFGESGNDKLYGFGGDDVIFGGNQNDSIFAGDGKDVLYGQLGNDTLDGGAGSDAFYGNEGDDNLIANDGEADKLDGGDGNDTMNKDDDESSVKLVELA